MATVALNKTYSVATPLLKRMGETLSATKRLQMVTQTLSSTELISTWTASLQLIKENTKIKTRATLKMYRLSTTMRSRRRKLTVNSLSESLSKTEEDHRLSVEVKRLRFKIPSCRWCTCTNKRRRGSATSATMDLVKMPATTASFSLMIVPWWWWSLTKEFSRTKDVFPETNLEEGLRISPLSTHQCSRRTRVVQARSLDSTSQTKPLDLRSETSSKTLMLEPLPQWE